MKKLLSLSVLTLGVFVLTERPAQAWVNMKFGVGLNWHLQSGGNNVLWGLFRNGQVPGPETFQQGGPMTPPGYQQGPNGFNYFGGAATPDNGTRQAMSSPTFGAIPAWTNQNYFQNVSYSAGYSNPNSAYYPQYQPSYYPQYQPTWLHYGW